MNIQPNISEQPQNITVVQTSKYFETAIAVWPQVIGCNETATVQVNKVNDIDDAGNGRIAPRGYGMISKDRHRPDKNLHPRGQVNPCPPE